MIDVTYADNPCSSVKSGSGVSFYVKDKYFADEDERADRGSKTESIKYQLEVVGAKF